MPRATTTESLLRISTGNEKQDQIVRRILMAINTNEVHMELQAVYETEFHLNEEYYGDFNDIGVTVRYAKKLFGIAGRYTLQLEVDSMEDTIEVSGAMASKAWNLCKKQEREAERKSTVSDESLQGLADMLGLNEPGE